MKAFVAGATGFTGREVVRLLCQRGIETIAHVRPDSSQLDHWKTHFTQLGAQVDTTPWESPAMRQAMADHQPDLIFALLGTTRKRRSLAAASSKETYMAIDYGLSSMLLRAAETQAPQARYIYLSSYGVRPGSPSSYIQARFELEEELKASRQPWIIARPAVIMGERDEKRLGEELAGKVGDAALKVLGALGAKELFNQYASLDAETLAKGLITAALSETSRHDITAGDIRRMAQNWT